MKNKFIIIGNNTELSKKIVKELLGRGYKWNGQSPERNPTAILVREDYRMTWWEFNSFSIEGEDVSIIYQASDIEWYAFPAVKRVSVEELKKYYENQTGQKVYVE